MRTELAAGLFTLSGCMHTPEVQKPQVIGRVESPASIISELLTTIAQVQRLDSEGQFMEDPTTPAKTDRVAVTSDPHELLSLSGYPHNGHTEEPGCWVEITRTSFDRNSVANPTAPDSRLSVTFMPTNGQNLLIGRGVAGDFTESINCYENEGVTSCTYRNGESTQPVSAEMVRNSLSAADLMCNSFRQIQ